MAQQVSCLTGKLALTEVEMCEIRNNFHFHSIDEDSRSTERKSGHACSDFVVTSAHANQLDDLDLMIRDKLDGQISPTLEWHQFPSDAHVESTDHGCDESFFDRLSSVSNSSTECTINKCIYVVVSCFNQLVRMIQLEGIRPSEWRPTSGQCFTLRAGAFTGFNYIEGVVNLDFLTRSFGIDEPFSFWSRGQLIRHDTSIVDDASILVTVESDSAKLSSDSKVDKIDNWKRIEPGRCPLPHNGVMQMTENYLYAHGDDFKHAWGVQLLNIRTQLSRCVCKCVGHDLWKVVIKSDSEDASFEAWCFFDSSWNDFLLLENDCQLGLFGVGWIGFFDTAPILMMPAISKLSTMINVSEFLPVITLDLFSGIGGWQHGSSQEVVVSVEKDPVIAKVHSAQTGMAIIDSSQINEIMQY